MSSPLDGRIRVIAEQVVAELTGDNTSVADEPRLQDQITDLHEHLHLAATTIKRLEDRVAALEAAASAPRRGARKTAGE